SDEALPTAAWRLMQQTQSRHAVVTMGPDGLVAFECLEGAQADDDGFRARVRGEHVPALSPYAIDALGCGDALLAACALALAAGGSLLAASFLGAVAAGVEAQRLGNIPVSATDLRQGVARVHGAHLAFAAAEVIGSNAR